MTVTVLLVHIFPFIFQALLIYCYQIFIRECFNNISYITLRYITFVYNDKMVDFRVYILLIRVVFLLSFVF